MEVGGRRRSDVVRDFCSRRTVHFLTYLLITRRDNRCTLHRVIPGNYPAEQRRGIRTTVFGEKRKFLHCQTSHDLLMVLLAYFDPASKSRDEALDSSEVKPNGHGSDHHKNGEMPG